VRSNWLLPSIFSFVMVSLPASAAEILAWQFNPTENRIDFTTSAAVKPSAQLLGGPARLVIDLPDTTLNKPTASQSLSNGLRSLRVGQVEPGRTRMVLELDPEYAIEPQQILIQANNPRQWSVQLPTPQPLKSFRNGAPIGIVSVFNEQGQIVQSTPFTPRPPTVAAATTIPINYIALDPTRTGVLIQADRQSKIPFRYTTSWDTAASAYRIVIPNARLGPNHQIPADSKRYVTVINQGDNVNILVRRADGVKVEAVRQYLDNRWVYLQPVGVVVAEVPGVTIPVPPPTTVRPPANNKNDPTTTTPPIRTNPRVLVMLDPGHGGKDPGAIGLEGLREVDVILPVALQVAQILRKNGIEVKMTRNSDYYVGLDERVTLSRQAGATLFVSIHANSIDNRPDVNGLELYHYNIGKSFAETVHRNVLEYVNKNGFFVADRRVRSARFLVLRKSSIPAILVETGYLTSETEAARLRRDDYRKVMAEGIAQGIMQYIKERN
jgi:N-acetylmuramoyl-L-alanine amidase